MKKKKTKKQRIKGHVIRIDIAIAFIVAAYLTFTFSSIPFIAKLRTLYIETAMTTMTHQWLATMFFPQSVIDEVMDHYYEQLAKQKELESKWKEKEEAEEKDAKEEADFYEIYWELDSPSVREYLKAHPELTQNGYDKILIEDPDQTLGLTTSEGDAIYAINVPNKLIIVSLKGNGYVGK